MALGGERADEVSLREFRHHLLGAAIGGRSDSFHRFFACPRQHCRRPGGITYRDE